MGLNFATMQYNGMGNRFRDLPQYQTLIIGHGVLAAITFIAIVPTAIFVAKYGHWNRRASYKLHVYLQILTVFLTTVVLVLGWFAVGPERSLTNPHHGIGVAIYVLVLFQFMYGYIMSRVERKRKVMPTKIPLKVWLHKIMGRSIAVLAFVQIALGLTLYGSPKSLFVLYALAGTFLLFLYLSLDYYYKDRVHGMPASRSSRGGHEYYSEDGSYVSGTEMTQDQRRRPEDRSHWGRNLLAGAGALTAYEGWKSRRDRRREERTDGRVETVGGYDTPGRQRPPPGDSTLTPITPSRRPSRSRLGPGEQQYGRRPPSRPTESRVSRNSWENEKYDSPPQRHTWRNRLLGAGAGVAAFEGVKGIFGRRRRQREDEDYDDNYRPPLGGNQNAVTQTDVSRVEAGQAPFSPDDPRRRNEHATHSSMPPASTMPGTAATPTRPPRRHRPGDEMYSDDERESFDDERDRPETLRDSIAVFGALGGFQNWVSRRRSRRGQQRVDQEKTHDVEDAERYNRRTSMNYPGLADRRRASVSDTVMTGATQDQGLGSNAEMSRPPLRPDANAPPLPAAAGAYLGNRQNVTTEEGYVLPPPPPGPPPGGQSSALRPPPIPGSAHMPPGAIEPDPSRLVAQNTAANEASAFGRGRPGEAGAEGLAAGALAGAAAGRTQSQSPSRYRQREESRNRIPPRQAAIQSGSLSQGGAGPAAGSTSSPPISLKVKMHNDQGGHVTLRRLNEEEAAAERAARRQERRQRRRRNSSLSSAVEEEPPGQRYRRTGGGMRPSVSQPIDSVPPPPAMSSAGGSARRDSEMNLPPMAPQAAQVSPPTAGRSNAPVSGSGLGNPMASPNAYGTDAGTGTDVSAFADNRRRRRAERARRLEAARGNRVEFE